ncbi:myophilin-like isoform X1 [Palaemon carinicauda]|uniref:myophilin-like isoform X1 n=1 Tax=Palaemon carinicauda TaxID=392227 RepID=UPI0035B5F5A8
MAYHGPSYGLSRECQMKSQAKFDIVRAREACDWVESVTGLTLDWPTSDGLVDQLAFGHALKDGVALCTLMNTLLPKAVPRISTMKAPFKQRENLELFLKGCESYGLKSQDLFQVNDLYENKNLYMVVDCLFALGGLAQKRSFDGPVIGVKVAMENRRNFSKDKLKESQKIIGLQYGSNKGASQSGMTAYGTGRQIIPGEAQKIVSTDSHKIIGLQSGSNKGASQAGMTPYGAPRQIIPDDSQKLISEDGHTILTLQSGSNKGASQAGMTPYGAPRQIIADECVKNNKQNRERSSLPHSVEDVSHDSLGSHDEDSASSAVDEDSYSQSSVTEQEIGIVDSGDYER